MEEMKQPKTTIKLWPKQFFPELFTIQNGVSVHHRWFEGGLMLGGLLKKVRNIEKFY